MLSIAIPTHQRQDYLVEAVASALAQDFDQPFEIVVVDDCPTSTGHEALVRALPQLARAPFRYLRNRQNLGMFNNLNRCIAEARGEWLTILHDDDLIDTTWAREMFGLLSARLKIDGLVCQKRGQDHRERPFREALPKRMTRRALRFHRFGGRETRQLTARHLFWSCLAGNTVGFLCRSADIRAIGGFYPEEHPSSDYFFYARFAERFRLEETRRTLATIRIADNSLMRREAQLACLRRDHELQLAYAGTALPLHYRWLSPLWMARRVANTERLWRSG